MGVFFCRDCVWVARLPSQQIKFNFDFDFDFFSFIFIHLRVCGTQLGLWLKSRQFRLEKLTAGSQNRRGSLGGRNPRFLVIV